MGKILIIAEIGSNFISMTRDGCVNTDRDRVPNMMKSLRDAGADLVKFQLWRAKDLYPNNHQYYGQFELPLSKFKEFFDYGERIGIEVFASVYYPEAVDCCEHFEVKRYKLASRTMALKDRNSKAVIEKVEATKKPVIASTGHGVYIPHFTRVRTNWKYLYCIPKYPASIEDFDVMKIKSRNGYSNHVPDPLPCVVAAALGAKIIETHVTDFRELRTPDAPCSLTLEEFKQMVQDIRKVEVMLSGHR